MEPSVSHTSALFTSPKAHEVGHRSGGRRSSLPKLMHVVDGTTEARTRGLPPKGCSFCTTPLPRSTAASKLSTWHWCFCSSCSWGHFAHTALEGQWKNSAEPASLSSLSRKGCVVSISPTVQPQGDLESTSRMIHIWMDSGSCLPSPSQAGWAPPSAEAGGGVGWREGGSADWKREKPAERHRGGVECLCLLSTSVL